MKTKRYLRSIAFYYLAAIPFLAAAIGFGVGHSPAGVYVPVWVVHTCGVILLLRKIVRPTRTEKNLLPAYLLIAPWLVFSIFAGFGPPPATMQAWLASAGEQQIRYLLLVAGGVCGAAGFALLNQVLAATAGARFAAIAQTLIGVSMPLFVLNMLYWGFFLPSSFQFFVAQHTTTKPDWYMAVRDLFYWVDGVQLSLFYLATGLFAAAFKASGLLKPLPCRIYMVISGIAVVCSLLPPGIAPPFNTIAYITAVPAIGFIMPYLMALNLIRINPLRQLRKV